MGMDVIITAVLGLIQGLTEFIPVSSSGHLVIAQNIFSGASDHKLLEFINIGTFLALVVYYRHRIVHIGREIIEQKKYSLARNILLTSIPAGIVGLLLSSFIDSSPFFGSLIVVVTTLLLVGILMIVLEHLPKASSVKSGSELSWQRALIIGLAQMCALVPGVSRSGSTIITGRLLGLSHKEAADYSFLASLPIMLAVTMKLFAKAEDRAYMIDHLPGLLIGNLVAFIAGLLAIGFLLRYLSRHDLKLFGWYRVGLAGIVLLVILLQ
jgi:undecaprenyl-diphosphatase